MPRSENEAARLHPLLFDNLVIRQFSPDHEAAAGPSAALGEVPSWRGGSLSVGPLQFDVGNADTGRDGRPAHFARVHLEGVHLFGGDVSGTFDGRAATIRLTWSTGD
ncbi:MAG TPA: hypothetical protein VN154_06150 [Rhizomicrobium sp.]|nr:hypothetical protein [Rhizomicrobium sp.]